MTTNTNDQKSRVGIVMGSKSDLPVMQAAVDILKAHDVPCDVRILSAHRTPMEADEYVSGAVSRGIQVLICGAGMAAHLAGAFAGRTLLPVIGVPLNASLGGLDALLATVQMPPGVPVATVSVGKAGAKNAAWLALRIMALSDPQIREALAESVRAMSQAVLDADAGLRD